MSENSSNTSSFAERLRIAREMAGLTQAQVATMLGLHRPTISEIEAGRRKVSAEELTKLAKLYGVGLGWLTEGDEGVGAIRDARLELAARELSKLTPEDLDRVVRLLVALRREEEFR
jgi:transcriptional regulator with XRE-family HTH domain